MQYERFEHHPGRSSNGLENNGRQRVKDFATRGMMSIGKQRRATVTRDRLSTTGRSASRSKQITANTHRCVSARQVSVSHILRHGKPGKMLA